MSFSICSTLCNCILPAMTKAVYRADSSDRGEGSERWASKSEESKPVAILGVDRLSPKVVAVVDCLQLFWQDGHVSLEACAEHDHVALVTGPVRKHDAILLDARHLNLLVLGAMPRASPDKTSRLGSRPGHPMVSCVIHLCATADLLVVFLDVESLLDPDFDPPPQGQRTVILATSLRINPHLPWHAVVSNRSLHIVRHHRMVAREHRPWAVSCGNHHALGFGGDLETNVGGALTHAHHQKSLPLEIRGLPVVGGMHDPALELLLATNLRDVGESVDAACDDHIGEGFFNLCVSANFLGVDIPLAIGAIFYLDHLGVVMHVGAQLVVVGEAIQVIHVFLEWNSPGWKVVLGTGERPERGEEIRRGQLTVLVCPTCIQTSEARAAVVCLELHAILQAFLREGESCPC